MPYPQELIFDIETLVSTAQPASILVVGNLDDAVVNDLMARLQNYAEQKNVLQQSCLITPVANQELDALTKVHTRFDLAIAINLFEHVSKQQGQQLLSKLRDVLTDQYCIALPLEYKQEYKQEQSAEESAWTISELFGFALRRVATYRISDTDYGLFKYSLHSYKNTPDWLNADNWANPQMWGKYWW